ncbi:GNAT family N-acetyltransferase [Litorilituus sediminis]|uniref:Protein ElaA n=1 Tax=Litorilituus sediminis TaxID=718192 RepID=A0A4P6P7E5_9GAMM|nr:GNAT family N-acetyltransferase [Litorilituus sediminis]QBG35327.1 GNAT family N-acetyltransferase [Litorilituus sediminis]
MTKLSWQSLSFEQLTTTQLYDLLKLRVDVFVVEQNCPYPDLDSDSNELDRHTQTIHLLGYQSDELIAYARILAKGQSYADYISIGRVVTKASARGSGLGHQLLQQALELCQQHYPKESIKISAQEHLANYYQQHGFKQVSPMYLEDNIPHIAMIKDCEK